MTVFSHLQVLMTSSHVLRGECSPSLSLIVTSAHRITLRSHTLFVFTRISKSLTFEMGCGLSKPSHQSSDEYHPLSRPRVRFALEESSEPGRRRMQRSGSSYMHGSRQDTHRRAPEQEQERYRRSREEGEINRLGEEYMQNFWEDARRAQDRARARNRKRFRLS